MLPGGGEEYKITRGNALSRGLAPDIKWFLAVVDSDEG